MRYHLSKNLRLLGVDGEVAAYNRLHGNLSVLSPAQHKFLLGIDRKPVRASRDAALAKSFRRLKYITPECDEDRDVWRRRDTALEVSQRINHFSGLLLKITDACNFSCSYCIDRASGSQGKVGNMGSVVALKAIDLFLDFCRRHRKYEQGRVTIGFNGGEPLLNFGLIRDCVRFVHEQHPDANVDFDLNTNAVLLTSAVAEFLKCHGFSITTSLDGNLILNDAQRHSKTPNVSAFAATVEGVRQLAAVNYASHATIILVLTERNIEGVDSTFLQFIKEALCVNRLLLEPDMSRALPISPRHLAERILAIKQVSQDVDGLSVGGGWSAPFLNLIKDSAHAPPSYCSALSGFSVNVFPSGDLRVCNYLDASFTLINLSDVSQFEDIIDHPSFKRSIYDNFGGTNSACLDCAIRGLCKGGCLVTATKGGEAKAYHCEFLREITDLLIRECVVSNREIQERR